MLLSIFFFFIEICWSKFCLCEKSFSILRNHNKYIKNYIQDYIFLSLNLNCVYIEHKKVGFSLFRDRESCSLGFSSSYLF